MLKVPAAFVVRSVPCFRPWVGGKGSRAMEAVSWHHGGLQTASSAAGCASQTLEDLISEVEEDLVFHEGRRETRHVKARKQECCSKYLRSSGFSSLRHNWLLLATK